MITNIRILILLLAVVAAAAVVASRLKIPAAILLVLIGLALSLTPGLPAMQLAPEFVLLLVLPPVIYSSAFNMSWREFRFSLRPITLLSVGGVLFTAVAVAAAAHGLMGFDWRVGFLLGAIISPPDAVAPLDHARGMEIPRRIVVILEGEGLANDAAALDPLSLRRGGGRARAAFPWAKPLASSPRSSPAKLSGASASAGSCCGCGDG